MTETSNSFESPESLPTDGVSAELPDLPEPFAADPLTPKVPSAGGGGCGKVALLGCGVLILLFGLGMMVFMFKANDLMTWVFQKLETEISKGLPDDLSGADRKRLDEAFEGFYAALESGEIDPVALQRLQGKLMELSASIEGGLSHEEVRDLTQALEGVAGVDEEPESEPQSEPAATEDPPSATVWNWPSAGPSGLRLA